MNVDMWHKSFSGPAGDVGAITKFIVEELYRKGDGWRQRFVDWASKSPWCDWSLPTIDRTKLVLRHGSVPGERFAIGIIRA
ncbi:MAG TPA: hypothetical protein VN420_01580 [Candidatus Fimivivens sp.]|nr:hypothetical protein [Candidatus Fimivivens sp.]